MNHYKMSLTKPMLKGTYTEIDYKMDKNIQVESNSGLDEDTLSYSLCSQMEYNISQNVENTCSLFGENNDSDGDENFYNIALPAYQAAVEKCQTIEEAEELSDYLDSFVFKMISRQGKHSMHDKGMSFFGEDLSCSHKKSGRHLFAYERCKKKKAKK